MKLAAVRWVGGRMVKENRRTIRAYVYTEQARRYKITRRNTGI